MILRAFLVMVVILAPVELAAQDTVTDPANLDGARVTSPGAASPPAPVLRVEFKKTETIPGQPLDLRLTVLVPTFMPKPPVWPNFEAPNLLVRVPGRGGGPTSERIDGETWSGVTRRWNISPMVPGTFRIPPQAVVVTWNDPETGKPRRSEVRTVALEFQGKLPEGAEGLHPFIAARSLQLTQDIEGYPDAMKPGLSARRTVRAQVKGVSPMFLPQLLPPTDVDGVAAYPDTPAMNEAEDRGVIGGSRIESVTLVAEGGGRGEAPPISLEWYNVNTGEVEMASVEGFEIIVAGPPAHNAEPHDRRELGLIVLGALLALAAAGLFLRRAWPWLKRYGENWHNAMLASEPYAYGRLRRAVARHEHASVRTALDEWALRSKGTDPRRDPAVSVALMALGRVRYGDGSESEEDAAWNRLAAALSAARKTDRSETHKSTLPPLNAGQ